MKTKTLRLSPVSKGMTFAGRYKILEEMGRGGMGVVFKAHDLKLKRGDFSYYNPPLPPCPPLICST